VLNAIFRPVENWPGKPTPTAERRNSPFQASYSDTLDLLERELNAIRAQRVVIEAYFRLDQIRDDGWPYSNTTPSQPGVIVSFSANGSAYSYPCDVFHSWEHNLRAIALSLESLRRVDRFGVTKRGEQYMGFKQLPPGSQPEAAKRMTAPEAAAFLAKIFPADVSITTLLGSKMIFEAILREAQKKLHPDAGGSHDQFIALQEAGEVLVGHHNAKGKAAV